MYIKKNDTVQVISGESGGKVTVADGRGVRGRVLRVLPEKNKLVVQGVAMVKKATRPNPRKGHRGGFMEKEMPISASKVMLVCRKCDRPVRVGFRIEGDKKIRYCRKCKQEV
jgi:large subunit ribosomal protein L24